MVISIDFGLKRSRNRLILPVPRPFLGSSRGAPGTTPTVPRAVLPAEARRSAGGRRREVVALGNLTIHGRCNGWMAILDPGTWFRALLAAALMSALACAVTLARDTRKHDWYATGKLTLTELLTGLGFDDRTPVEYRTSAGALLTLTRDGLMYNGDALLARDHLLRIAAKAAGLGA